MRKRSLLALLLALCLLLSACSDQTQGGTDSSEDPDTPTGTAPAEINTSDLFTDRDLEWSYDESKSTHIQLSGSSAACDSNAVQISGSTVTITDEGTYILSGNLDDGMIIVNAEKTDKTQLVLSGVSINSAASAPIYILQADKVFITLVEGSVNTLSNGGSFTAIDENNIDSVIFSKEDLTLNGAGWLTVTSPAGHGIVSKDDLTVASGSYTIQAASHGITGKDCVTVKNAALDITAGKDGIQADNGEDAALGFVYIEDGSFTITAEGDGISASANMQIDGGTFTVTAGGGSVNGEKQSSDSWGDFMGGGMGGMGGGRPRSAISGSTASESDSTSMKGIKSGANLQINDGIFTIDSADDALHSNADLTITGGTYEIASGDDGIHAEENLTVTDGTVNITECYEGLEALHIKVQGGDIKLIASDDGLNAAGGTDSSGITGGRDGMFGGMGGRPGGMGGGMSSSNGSIVISGGTLYINSSGDGLDANGTLTISGGHTTVVGPTQGDTATLDYDTSGIITGGTFIGTGASGMAQTFSDSEQGVIAVSVGSQSAGTQITLTDSKGNVVISYAPELNFAVVILSSPDIVKGQTYTITVGTASGEFEAD